MTVTGDRREGAAVLPGGQGRSNVAMSLTYSDFLYTRNDYYDGGGGGTADVFDGEEERQERRRLPADFKPIQETKVPLMQNEDDANRDFIIVAEFSELEGPIPLCTIPNDATDKTDIKLDDFVVHLMSTDYQVNTAGKFRICQDTQVVRKNVFQNVHVFMQYFTMYDLKARGFVRPFCFGYVTKDHIKLDKYVKFLVTEFGKVTSVLEYSNRKWFCDELNLYLTKLQAAKDSYIQECNGTPSEKDSGGGVVSSGDENDSDEFVDSDAITSDQIAHQYSEILNILTIVQKFETPNLNYLRNIISETSSFFDHRPETDLTSFLKKINLKKGTTFSRDITSGGNSSSSESLNIPLVHPLRSKGEPLRPLTFMGQLGTVYLVGKLMQIYESCKMDIICTEMTETTLSFRQHFKNLRIVKAHSSSEGNSPVRRIAANEPRISSSISNLQALEGFSRGSISPFEIAQDNKLINSVDLLLLNTDAVQLLKIIEKLHSPAPVIPDNKSGSYHTVSEEDSDVNLNIPSATSQTDFSAADMDFGISSVDSVVDTNSSGGTPSSIFNTRPTKNNEAITPPTDEGHQSVGAGSVFKLSSLSSFSSDEEISLTSSPTKDHALDTSEETIVKEPWWIYVSQKLVRGVPGYGIANFFRRYHDIAHHVLYSILLGRPIIICGEEKMSRRIGRIITALIPLIPGRNHATKVVKESGKNSATCWKLLRWHRGILVQSHIETYRLIGLCIPEKLEVHDLIPPRLLTLVTIISAEKKTILGGPAYSGDLLQMFEKKMQEHFSNSDVSLLSYIGGLYTEVEGKVYMYKSLAEKYMGNNKTSNKNIYLLFKELNLRASDIEIVKYLSNLTSDPSECVDIL